MENNTGVWKCLVRNSVIGENETDYTTCPPGRNAATLTRVNVQSLSPNALSGSLESSNNAYYLLQGGWNPFRATYNDCFVLRVSSP